MLTVGKNSFFFFGFHFFQKKMASVLADFGLVSLASSIWLKKTCFEECKLQAQNKNIFVLGYIFAYHILCWIALRRYSESLTQEQNFATKKALKPLDQKISKNKCAFKDYLWCTQLKAVDLTRWFHSCLNFFNKYVLPGSVLGG